MELQADKLMVIQALIELEDQRLLEEIKSLLSEHFSNPNAVQAKPELTETDKVKIARARLQYERGEVISHEEVQAKAKKILNS